jgi:IMP dehydrogenase
MTSTIREAERIMRKNNVGSLVVLNEEGVLVGILTSRDIRFCNDEDMLVSQRMNGRGSLITAPMDTQIREAKKILDDNRLEKLPLVDDQGHLVGLITSKDIKNLEKYPLANKDDNGQLIVGAAIGATGDYLERAGELIKAGVDVIVIDIANAQSDIGLNATQAFRGCFPKMELVVGNIAIGTAISRYQGWGVNGFKVGLGPGSACTTRYHTNIGVTQAYAIYDCACEHKIPIIADGGIRRNGHIFLSLLHGGSSVMIGGLFGGTDEAPGHVIRNSKGVRVKKFRGMASREAMFEKLVSELADDPYETSSRISPEGIEKELEYRGSVVPIIHDMMNHLASSISYMGAKSLVEAQEMFTANPKKYLTKISSAAQVESWRRDV